MEQHEKEIIFTPHANKRAAEKQFDSRQIRDFLRNGFICKDPKEPCNSLCIYNIGKQYYTAVFCEYDKAIVIITVYRSNDLEIRKAEAMKHGLQENRP